MVKKRPAASDDAASLGRHNLSGAEATGAGDAASALVGRQVRCVLWDLQCPLPKWVPPPVRRGILPAASSVGLELQLAQALQTLRKRLTGLCVSHGLKARVRPLTFERWRFAAKFEEEVEGKPCQQVKGLPKNHPVLPAATKAPKSVSALAEELQRQGLQPAKALEVAQTLEKDAGKLCTALAKARHQVLSGKTVSPPELLISFHRHSVDLQCGEAFVKVGRAAYGKLALLHRRHSPSEAAEAPQASFDGDELAEAAAAEESAVQVSGDAAVGPRGALHLRMFALLLRYKSLCGHGFQAALGPMVWTVLKEELGVAFECFASPLNAHLPQFCSGFEDVDAVFGSRGSFFNFRPLTGSFAANPPFVHSIMDAMAAHLIALLEAADAAKERHALSFAVFLPGWTEGKAYSMLSTSAFLRRLVLIAAADHGYCDGASHQRQDPFRQSPYDTACFFLQSDRASRKWPVGDGFEERLREAMAKCVPLASSVQRQQKKRKRKVS